MGVVRCSSACFAVAVFFSYLRHRILILPGSLLTAVGPSAQLPDVLSRHASAALPLALTTGVGSTAG
eukprot:4321394-Alexandrium_andersonii.AAC.1